MEKEKAALLVTSLVDRLELDANSGKWRLNGVLSKFEKEALEMAASELAEATIPEPVAAAPSAIEIAKAGIRDEVSHERGSASGDVSAEVIVGVPKKPTMEERAGNLVNVLKDVNLILPDRDLTVPLVPPKVPEHLLNLKSVELGAPENAGVTLCLDFGTAMSKAFAMAGDEKPVELALGMRAGGSGYPVDSTLFITSDGLIEFGPLAMSRSATAAESGRARFDSPKARLSMGQQGDIDNMPVGEEINPTDVPLSEGDLIILYLGYLTDLAVSELEDQGYSRYVFRRFARPCWSEDRNRWAEPLLRRMLAQAQIVADTFKGRWQQGIPVGEAKSVLVKLHTMKDLPHYLLDQGIPEPVAAASSLMIRDEAQREIFMVIDVGAGTTDFGMFLLQHNPAKEVCLTRIIPGSIQYLPEAGNRVDDLLKTYLLDVEGIDPGSAEGKHNMAYLNSRIRLYKESLFQKGVVEVTLANHSRVVVKKDDFLNSNRVQNFSQRLGTKFSEVLSAVGDGYLDLLARTDLKVVLTGGGASLPMVADLSTGVIEVKGRKIMRTRTPLVPNWIEESYPQFAPQYPQLAVAIGGATPDLPEQAESFPDFLGMGIRTFG